jgi:hypothetical protein
MPPIPPSTNKPVRISASGRRAARYDVTPDALASVITTREVATPRCMAIPPTRTRAGTMTNPPPTPKSPDKIPVQSPTTAKIPMRRGVWDNPLRMATSAASDDGSSWYGETVRDARRHIHMATKTIRPANSTRSMGSGMYLLSIAL